MSEAERATVWSVLNQGFESIYLRLKGLIPKALMQSGHHSNESFSLRAYAEFSLEGRAIIIAFNAKRIGNNTECSGDISREDGYVVGQLIFPTLVVSNAGEACQFEVLANQFISRCHQEFEVLVEELK